MFFIYFTLLASIFIYKQIKKKRKEFSETYIKYVFDKILHYTKRYLLKNPFFMFLANYIFFHI